MGSINKAIIVGYLGKDPEIRMTQGGKKVANFSIATSEKRNNKQTGQTDETTEWHNLILWDKLAEIAEKYLKKGSLVYIEGKLQTRKWQDKDGNDRYTTEIVGQNLTMLGGKGEDKGRDFGSKQSDSPRGGTPKQVSEDAPFDDEIPF